MDAKKTFDATICCVVVVDGTFVCVCVLVRVCMCVLMGFVIAPASTRPGSVGCTESKT